ncbi:hypothetical protein N9137_03375 [Pseudomonadales bacterium]|nr:hypothetical protein [Pseudomonadales bacterium]
MSTNTYNTYDDSFTSSTTDTAGAMSHDEAVTASYEEARQNMAFSSQTRTHENDTAAGVDTPVFTSYAGAGDSIAFSQTTANSTVTIGGYETTVAAAISAGLITPEGTPVGLDNVLAAEEPSTEAHEVESEVALVSEEAQTTLDVIDTYAPALMDEVIESLVGEFDEVDGQGMDTLEQVIGLGAMDKVNDLIAEAETSFEHHFGDQADSLRAACETFSHTPMVRSAMKLAARGDMSGFEEVQRVIKAG